MESAILMLVSPIRSLSADDAVALMKPPPRRPVEQRNTIQSLQRTHPFGVGLEFAGRVHAADQRAHRAAGDERIANPSLQLLDHADVRIAARTSGAEHQRDRERAVRCVQRGSW
jgi:hypothetical protein